MIEFDGRYYDVKLTSDGKYIKVPLNDNLIKYIVGELISVSFEHEEDYRNVCYRSYANTILVSNIVAVKFQDGTLKNLLDSGDSLD